MLLSYLCAWCDSDIPFLWPRSPSPEGGVSHGICFPCANRIYRELGIDLENFLELLGVPVVLVDGDVVVRSASSKACRMAGKGLRQVEGLRGGVVFLCAYSAQPGGCGGTIHCSGCAIRNSVTHTYATGEELCRVPATLHQQSESGDRDIAFLVSTKKAGDFVLLAMDRVLQNAA